jgi:hypothetical protein
MQGIEGYPNGSASARGGQRQYIRGRAGMMGTHRDEDDYSVWQEIKAHLMQIVPDVRHYL